MKANKLFVLTIFSLISIQAMSPTDFMNSIHKSINRKPSSEAKKTLSKKEETALKEKLSVLEEDLTLCNSLLEDFSKEEKNDKTEDNIKLYTKLIAQQKLDIAAIKDQLKDAEVVADQVNCKSELKGEKLEADMMKLIDDVDVFKKIEIDHVKLSALPEVKQGPKAEPEMKVLIKNESIDKIDNTKLKEKLAELPEVKEEKVKKKKQKEYDSEVIDFMSQVTSLFAQQMQAQSLMQAKMLDMLSSMQSNILQESPYAFRPAYSYPYTRTLSERIDRESESIGYHPDYARSQYRESYRDAYSDAYRDAYKDVYRSPYTNNESSQQTLPYMYRQPSSENGFTFPEPLQFNFGQQSPVLQPQVTAPLVRMPV